jgi:hypothetical protein
MARMATMVLSLFFGVFAFPLPALEPEDGETKLVVEMRKSVAWLEAICDGKPSHATGFVVQRADGKKIIITSGHVFRNGMSLRAWLPGMSSPVPCKLVDRSFENDLMAVSLTGPVQAPAMRLIDDGDTEPGLNDRVLLVGCEGGLEPAHHWGHISALPTSAKKLRQLYELESPSGETVLLRHDTYSKGGMSGGPLIDLKGRVIGIQMGTLPNSSNVCFGVHAKHISQLRLGNEPRAFLGGQAVDSNIHNVLAVGPKSDAPMLIRLGDEEVDARCSHLGYVPDDAETVITRYIQDEERFRKFFTKDRLQKLLDENRIAHITNSAFSFQVLVPKGYLFEIGKMEQPDGIIVTFTSADPAISPPYNRITVRALLNTNYYLRAKHLFDEGVRDGSLVFPPKLDDTPFMRTVWKKGVMDGIQGGMISVEFPVQGLGLRVRYDNNKPVGNPEGEIFRARSAGYPTSDETTWLRANFDAESGTSGHAMHCGLRDNLIVVVHYQFQLKDRDNFFAGKQVSNNFLERAFIASTVSLY